MGETREKKYDIDTEYSQWLSDIKEGDIVGLADEFIFHDLDCVGFDSAMYQLLRLLQSDPRMSLLNSKVYEFAKVVNNSTGRKTVCKRYSIRISRFPYINGHVILRDFEKNQNSTLTYGVVVKSKKRNVIAVNIKPYKIKDAPIVLFNRNNGLKRKEEGKFHTEHIKLVKLSDEFKKIVDHDVILSALSHFGFVLEDNKTDLTQRFNTLYDSLQSLETALSLRLSKVPLLEECVSRDAYFYLKEPLFNARNYGLAALNLKIEDLPNLSWTSVSPRWISFGCDLVSCNADGFFDEKIRRLRNHAAFDEMSDDNVTYVFRFNTPKEHSELLMKRHQTPMLS